MASFTGFSGAGAFLDEEKDAELIANYRKPAYVLKGWEPLSYIKK